MQRDADHSNAEIYRSGRLAIVGSGIAAIAHLTLETIGYIQEAALSFITPTVA
jgi:hypothetical protein